MATNVQEQIAKDLTAGVVERNNMAQTVGDADRIGEWVGKVYAKILTAVVAADNESRSSR